LNKKSIWSWALYDWANSAFATTVMAGFFPLFFNAYWADPNNPAESTFYLGIANSMYAIIVALLAPLFGAIADRGNARKKFLIFFAFLGAVFTASLWVVSQGNWLLAIIVYIGASIGFSSGNIFYDSLLLTVAPRDKLNMVSSLGFSMGYIGGGILFALNVLMFLNPEFFGIPDQSVAVKISFLSVAVWWILFTIPLILYVREPMANNSITIRRAIPLGFHQLRNTLHQLKHFKIVSLFLLAYWFYIDGVDTIVKMAVDYGLSIGFKSSTLMTALLIVQFIAFPAALIYNWVAIKIGTKEAIMTSIVAYIFITILGYFMHSETSFYILAILIGLFQGGIQALSRSLYSRIIPKSQAAEFFGFFNMLGKFAAVIGPLLIGSVTFISGNARLGILSILFLFIFGAFLLMLVDFKEGERLAKEFDQENLNLIDMKRNKT
tara:strand:+ start:34685 stop:35992 length:1308 start_codon:yes stop_codon:yes gene_type:complete